MISRNRSVCALDRRRRSTSASRASCCLISSMTGLRRFISRWKLSPENPSDCLLQHSGARLLCSRPLSTRLALCPGESTPVRGTGSTRSPLSTGLTDPCSRTRRSSSRRRQYTGIHRARRRAPFGILPLTAHHGDPSRAPAGASNSCHVVYGRELVGPHDHRSVSASSEIAGASSSKRIDRIGRARALPNSRSSHLDPCSTSANIFRVTRASRSRRVRSTALLMRRGRGRRDHDQEPIQLEVVATRSYATTA